MTTPLSLRRDVSLCASGAVRGLVTSLIVPVAICLALLVHPAWRETVPLDLKLRYFAFNYTCPALVVVVSGSIAGRLVPRGEVSVIWLYVVIGLCILGFFSTLTWCLNTDLGFDSISHAIMCTSAPSSTVASGLTAAKYVWQRK